jgi:hypothetical protein
MPQQSAGPGGVESGAMRSEVPPPGRPMSFEAWSAAIVDGVRGYLPDARAVRKGSRVVIIRHGGREAHLENDGSAFVVRFRAGDSKTTMSGLVESRPPRRTHDVDVSALGCRFLRRAVYAREHGSTLPAGRRSLSTIRTVQSSRAVFGNKPRIGREKTR